MAKQPDPDPAAEAAQLAAARDEFVTQWGAIGNAWGINRTMAQIHALLMTSPRALTTDEVMEQLKISRGNAHTNLRELVGWGLIRSVVRLGERKEYFEAEKDVWKMFCIIVRERKRREIRPAINVLQDCLDRAESLKAPEAVAFTKQTRALCEFMEMADGVLSKIARSEASSVIPWALKFIK
jgi:DNA-binding transcriptional regulator GbsR (MarR family)